MRDEGGRLCSLLPELTQHPYVARVFSERRPSAARGDGGAARVDGHAAISGYRNDVASNGANTAGTAFLLTAAPAGKSKLMDASSVVPSLAAIPPSAWTGTVPATLIELADPVEPQAVLTRLRAVAHAEGPLTLVLVGQLLLDRRHQGVHLALARTTPTTVRYTGFPWEWLLQALRFRRPGATTVFADLATDARTWDHLRAEPLSFGQSVDAYGLVGPAPNGRQVAQPRYLQALAQMLRAGSRDEPEQLHQAVLREIGDMGGGLVLAPGTRVMPSLPPQPPVSDWPVAAVGPPDVRQPPSVPVVEAAPAPRTATAGEPAQDPRPYIHALALSGRHQEADGLAQTWEEHALHLYGFGSPQVAQWVELRADLAKLAGDLRAATQLWIAAARTRLLQQHPGAAEVLAAARSAHYCWTRVEDPADARDCGPELISLLRTLPLLDERHLSTARQRQESLDSASPDG